MSGAIRLLPLYAFMAWTGTALPYTGKIFSEFIISKSLYGTSNIHNVCQCYQITRNTLLLFIVWLLVSTPSAGNLQ
jgi:hypothetical protein